MKRIRYLTVRFDAEIKSYEIPAFRSAIIEKAGREHLNFHNHLGDSGFNYRYPVIQYKRIGRNAAIVCVDEGVDDIHHFFANRSWDIHIGDRPVTLQVKDLRLNQYTLQAWEHTFRFCITDWIALNQENYARYEATTGLIERAELLERTLTGNILSMAKGLDWFIDKTVLVNIRDIAPIRWQKFKEQRMATFDVEFDCNVFLPDFIGLGKGVSTGFGVVTQLRNNRQRTIHENKQSHPQPDDEY
ncbi:CRISPR-associated endonuclease Cas6 [Spirosoma koreense]